MTSSGFQPGDVVSGYRIEGVLGHGGMGTVYAARHPTLPRTVALKVLLPQYAESAEFRTRFLNEAQTLLGLPGVYHVHIHAHDGETTIDYNPLKTIYIWAVQDRKYHQGYWSTWLGYNKGKKHKNHGRS